MTNQHAPRKPPSRDYQAKKLAGRCVENGCGRAPADGADLCGRHLTGKQSRQARWIEKRRAAARLAKLCIDCRETKTDDTWCPACRLRRDRYRSGVDANVDGQGDRSARIQAATRKDTEATTRTQDRYARERYHGRSKRGQPPAAELDQADIVEIRKATDKLERALAYYRSPEVQELGRIQRDDAKQAALSYVYALRRFADEVLHRNRFEWPEGVEE